MWEEKAKMAKRGFECLQYSVCEHLYRTERGEKCRIRFGAGGVVYTKRDTVFWFFGHLDNTKISEWIVKDAISACGTKEKQVVHNRKMRIKEVSNALKVIEKRKKDEIIMKEAIEVQKQKKFEEDTIKADKAMEELLADFDDEKNTVAPKRNKNKKKNRK